MTTTWKVLHRGLRNATMIALSPTLPNFLTRTVASPEVRKVAAVLVIIQPDGGYDGMHTGVTFKDEDYLCSAAEMRECVGSINAIEATQHLRTAKPVVVSLLDGGVNYWHADLVARMWKYG
jgi:hypothetical protein